MIPPDIRSPIPSPGRKVWYGDFETPFLAGRGMGFFDVFIAKALLDLFQFWGKK
jgi:hypothetical protein